MTELKMEMGNYYTVLCFDIILLLSMVTYCERENP